MSQLGIVGQPISQPTGGEIFDMAEENRVEYMRSLGARNVDPPRPRSSHLKIRATGVVMPWNELLAEQVELVDNCDEHGNTDPEAWSPTIDPRPFDLNEELTKKVQVEATILSNVFRQPDAVNPVTPLPMEYPNNAIPLADIDKLNAMLES